MTRGPLIHGALLVAALAFAYQTWTRDDTTAVDRGEFPLWDQPASAFESLTFENGKKTVRLERRSDDGRTYLWATVTRETERPKPKAPEPKPESAKDERANDESDDGADDASPDDDATAAAKGDAAGADATADKSAKGGDDKVASDADGPKADEGADTPAPDTDEPDAEAGEPEMIVETEVEEFPAGKTGNDVIEAVAPLMALRDLGTPQGKELDTFGLADPTMSLSVEFKDVTRSLQIGGRVYGGSDRYVRDPESGRTFVIDGSKLRVLEGGSSALRDNRLIAAERDDVAAATVIAGEARRDVVRVSVPATAQSRARVFWASAGSPDQEDATLTNFMSRVEKLVPLGFETDIDTSELVEVGKFEYRDEGGELIDTVVLLRGPGKSEDKPEYYARSQHTRVHARLNRPLTAQIEEDLAQVTEVTE